jgi:hypothetical protein
VEQASAIGVLRLTPFQMIAHIHWAVHGPARQLHRSDPESRADETTNWPCIPTSGTSTWHGRRTTSSRANTDHYTRRAPICQASPRFLLGCKRRHSSFSGTLQTSSATTGCAWAAARLVNHSSASWGKDHRGRRHRSSSRPQAGNPRKPCGGGQGRAPTATAHPGRSDPSALDLAAASNREARPVASISTSGLLVLHLVVTVQKPD